MVEPTDAAIDAAIQAALATDAGRAHELADGVDDDVRFMFQQAMAAAMKAHRSSDLPAYEPPTCGSDYWACERALRIIERATFLGETMTCDAMEQIKGLCDGAGSAFNREALRRDYRQVDDDDLPF